MSTDKNPYEWKENNACVATYKVLEGDMFLDQFEDKDIPFEVAGDVVLSTLNYYPKTTNNHNIIEVLSLQIATKFIKYIQKVYTVNKENDADTSADIISDIASIFSDSNKTIKDLAEIVDEKIKFPDET